MTVLIAFGANFLVAVAKTWAAALTGSASMVAEAAHSWADTGNEIHPAVRLRALEAQIRQSPAVVDCTLSLSAPDEVSLVP